MLVKKFDEQFLASLGAEAIRLLCAGDFDGLADRFGYMLAFDRAPADAIREDLREALEEAGGAAILSHPPTITVGRFKPNDNNMFAVVECRLQLSGDAGVLLAELMVFGEGAEKSVCLEQISHIANQ